MHYGTVAWFDAQRGIGVIMIEGSGFEVSVRSTQIDGGGRQSLTAHTASPSGYWTGRAVHEPPTSTSPDRNATHPSSPRRTPTRDNPDQPGATRAQR